LIASAGAASAGRILVVDDEEAMLRLVSRSLSSAGYEVTIAADGRKAVELLAAASFDAVVSDIDMPRMSGIQLLQLVRQGDLDIPVILMTGAPSLETAVKAVSLGALLYLTKPVDMAELEKAIARAVRLKQVVRLKQEALTLVNEGGLGLSDRLALQTSFDRALETLWLAYQPIVRVSDQSLFGYEALVRSAEQALPHPGALLDAAQRLGKLDDVGRRVRAIAAGNVADAPPDSLIFVNLHARDLLDETLLHAASPLSAVAQRVVLEITERASLDVVPDARAKIVELRRMGFRIAIDDLGAGYAGLTSFATLEPELVKLDMSLVRDVDKNPMKGKLVRSMTALCKDLGMLVVAEGVETIEERDRLVELGCDLLQGYLLGRPARALPAFVWPAASALRLQT
jgi:EAL domain-containing protein (putative c-di-GMP-specific phosphodiesterase class I)